MRKPGLDMVIELSFRSFRCVSEIAEAGIHQDRRRKHAILGASATTGVKLLGDRRRGIFEQ